MTSPSKKGSLSTDEQALRDRISNAGWEYARTYPDKYRRRIPYDGLDIASAHMDGLEAARWIPTTERLPPWTEDRHEFVLVYSDTHDWQGKRVEVMRAMDFYAYSPDDDDPGTEDSKVVTHWMPLPEPPK